MSILFVILVILASVVLALFVLIQNPKGGGLAGNIAGFSNQFMGVKQTTDVLEKGTWIFAGVIGVLCMLSALFVRGASGGDGLPNSIDKATNAPAPAGTTNPVLPENTTTLPAPAPATTDSVNK